MLISISQKQVSPLMLPQSAYQGLEREELEAELVGVKSRKCGRGKRGRARKVQRRV
uniref:Uncharacterized protein n=1 Tax=Cucumis melo TaxID=3656 RepID=A0A9I9DVC6_CUCME